MNTENARDFRLIELIDSIAPDPAKMPYYSALFAGSFTKDQTMAAQLQDLARSLGCTGLREIQIEKLNSLLRKGCIDLSDSAALMQIIADEFEGENKKSHYAIRLQIFDGSGYTRSLLERVSPLAASRNATSIFRSIFQQSGLLEITAAVGAIERWYAKLAGKLEETYLKLGYSPYQVETYRLHKNADIWHSTTSIRFVEKYLHLTTPEKVTNSIKEGFESVLLYDEARHEAALLGGPLEQFFNS